MGISKINHNFVLKLHYKFFTALDTPALVVKSTIPAHEQLV